MKPTIPSHRTGSILHLFAIAAILAASASAQSVVGHTVHRHFPGTPVPFEQARLAAEKATRVEAIRPAVMANSSAPAEIVELARALNNDPDLIYQYVHDNIQFTPLFGLLKGPVGTLLDGQGDAFDQSSLMVALLNQASLTNPAISNVMFEFGQLFVNETQLQSWLGTIPNDDPGVAQMLAQGGIPGEFSFALSGAGWLVGHVWVKVSINGVPYAFDPAFKTNTWKTGIVSSLPGIMGYTQAQFFADANPTLTATSIQGVNRTQLRNDLTTYASNLAAYIRANVPTAGVNDIVGGPMIVPTPLVNGQTVRQTTNPNQSGTPTDWVNIPSQYIATLSITLPGAAAQTYNSSDIYGHRLSIFFNSSYVPALYLDGVTVVSGTASSQGAQVGIALSASLPWMNVNQSVTQYVSAQTNQNGGSGGYIVQTGWDQTGRGMIEKHRTLLNQAIKSGAASNSELVLGETLAVLGYTYFAETAAQQHLSDQLLGTTTQSFYAGGIVGEGVGTSIVSPYVDLGLNFANTSPRTGATPSQQYGDSLAAFLDSSGVSSAFESAMLEQTQAQVPGFAAASTIKLLDTALQNGDTIFDINNGNTTATQQTYTSTIRPQMAANYDAGVLAFIDSSVTQGFRVIAPLHGRIAIGAWTGTGYKTLMSSNGGSSYGELVAGGLNGGVGGVNVPPLIAALNALASMLAATADALFNAFYQAVGSILSGDGTGNVGDPVDHVKGSYQHQHDDLTIGAKSFPYGLTFQRQYDSGAQSSVGPLGNGWTHNFAISATVGSDGFAGMGQASALSAVNSIVSLYVSSDLMKNQPLTGQANLENFVLETVVNRWFTDQLTQNVVTVSRGWTSEKFTIMADGTYAAPIGSATILDAPGGTFRYRTKTGATLNFNSSGQISSWTNAAGASVTFGYTNGLLTTVANSATGRQLSLGYSGNLVSSVSDGTRSVSYGYSNGNLTRFTDALNQNITYAYDTTGAQDTAGHLTQIFYPSNPTNPFVTTFYDSLGRVKQQKDANGNLSQTFIAGARTEVDDAVGNRHVWYNDPRGNVTTKIQDYGYSPHLNITTVHTYDAQSDLLTSTLPEGNSVAYSYDALLNPLNITETAKPGSPLSPITSSFTYTVPVASLSNFEEIHTSTDPNGNVTTFAYNASTGTLATLTQPAVTKPGVGFTSPQEAFTYTAIGLAQSSQDAEGRTTRYDYDQTHADQVTKLTVDYGRLNLATQYGYDAYGDATSVTDANGNITTSTFDNLRRLTQVNGAVAGVVTKLTYFPDSKVATTARQVTAGTWETTQYSYSLSDKLRAATDPSGNSTTTTYDADDRKQTLTTQVTASQNRQRTFTYDPLSRPFQVSDTTAGIPGTVLETHTYTPNGLESTFVDANGHVTGYAHDGFDRLSQITYPDASTEQFQYDANSNLVQKTTRLGQNIGFVYDALNRPMTKTPSGELAGQVTYGYDLTSRPLQASDGSSANPYQIGYDSAGRANSFTDQLGRNTQVQYDAVGNRTRLQWPANTNNTSAYYVTYKVDPLNRMTEIDANGSAATPLAKYQWDALSRQTLITYGDGTTDSYSQYDADDHLLTLTQSFAGNVGNVTFGYQWLKDQQRQVTAASNPQFQYTPTTGTTNYASDVDNAYTSAGGAGLTYDGNHNLTFDGFNTLTYDVENRLIQAQNALSGTSQYLYDPLGRRKQKLVSGVTTQFVLAGGDEIADYAGVVLGPGTPLSLTVRGVGGLPVAAISPSTGVVTFYHHDVLGSTVAVTQAGTSGPADIYTYGEFGLPGAGSWATYRLAGYRYDNETGLYYVGARYYSPTLGRFLQPDPSGEAGGANLYAYVGNDPLNATDPTGKITFCPWCGAIGATVGAIDGALGLYANNHDASFWNYVEAVTTGAVEGGLVGLFAADSVVGGAVAGALGAAIGDYTGQESAASSKGVPFSLNVPELVTQALLGLLSGGAGGTISADPVISAAVSGPMQLVFNAFLPSQAGGYDTSYDNSLTGTANGPMQK